MINLTLLIKCAVLRLYVCNTCVDPTFKYVSWVLIVERRNVKSCMTMLSCDMTWWYFHTTVNVMFYLTVAKLHCT